MGGTDSSGKGAVLETGRASAAQHFRAALARRARSIISLNPRVDTTTDFAHAVADGLAAPVRRIPSRFLYDDVGSALYEMICEVPEYYLTRTETALLARHARDLRARTGPANIVELGAGSSQKAGLLLGAALQTGHSPQYIAIDVCQHALQRGQEELARTYPTVASVGLHGRFEDAVTILSAASPVLVLFLGSTVGNCSEVEAASLLDELSRQLSPGDFFLLGLDLVKDARLLHAAYNDATGITAAFTRNLFVRMNRELGAGVHVEAVEHEATWIPDRQHIEICARFGHRQDIHVAPLGLSFAIERGERIQTEISRKYRLESIPGWLGRFGFVVEEIYRDERDWYALILLRKSPDRGERPVTYSHLKGTA
jgi:L-histidine N-alpha-methyltransferase